MKYQLAILSYIISQVHDTPPFNGVDFTDNGPIKGVTSVNNILTPKAFPVSDTTKLPRPHYRINSINELGTTPKGGSLSNIWGTDKALNIYGPKGDPRLLNLYPWASTTYGKMFGSRYVTISRNYSIKGGEIDPLADAPVLKKRMQSDNVSCIIELKKNYPFCSMYNGDCQKCTASDVCVYNFGSNKCFPGNAHGDSCNTSPQYAFGVQKCNNSLASNGVFKNIDNLYGGRVKSINAQLRKRLGATGPWWSEMDDAGKTRVISGSFTNLSPEDFSVREPMYVDKLSNGQTTPAEWKPTLNPDFDVVSGHVGSLSKDARSLVNPGVPTVISSPVMEPTYVSKIAPPV